MGASPEKQKPDRFAAPKGSFYAPAVGAARYGLPDKLGRRVRQHEYEAEAAANNVAAQDAEAAPKNGLRFAAGQDYMGRLEDSKEAFDDWKRPNKPAFKETLSSLDNPLRTEANDPSSLPFYTQRNITAAQIEEQQAAKGKRCFPRNERYGMMEQLTSGTLLPLSGTEMREARQVARQAAAPHASCTIVRARPYGVQPTAQGQAGALSASHTHDACDEDAEVEEGAEGQGGERGGQGQEVDESGFPTADPSAMERGKKAVMQQAADELATLQELEEQIIKDYPHGAPKHLLFKLAKERGLLEQGGSQGVPSLGFGFPSCLSSKMAAATLRP